MADFLPAKVAAEVVERTWTIPADATAVSTSASGVTVDSSEARGTEIVFVLSGGTAGQTGAITATITTSDGQTLIETIYVPVIASTAIIADTARDYVNFALRKVTGIDGDPSASELADALEHLNALVADWRATGADIGAPFPITANDVIYCPDYAVSALRYNLLIACRPLYGDQAQPTPYEYDRANRGLQLVKQKNLPEVREAPFF